MGVLNHNGHAHDSGRLGADHDTYETLRVAFDNDVCSIQIHRPAANNAINNRLIRELHAVLDQCERGASVVVLEGLPEVFCFGADFGEIDQPQDAEGLYDAWLKLAAGPFVSVAHVRGKANAGGVGFVAACDLVISEERAVFSLSELLFGLMPACVLPFLIRRIGAARANLMTVLTQPVSAEQALHWGLVDVCAADSVQLLRRQLVRLRRLAKPSLARYKGYRSGLDGTLLAAREGALRANREVFSDRANIEGITRYVSTGKFPWEP